MNKEEIKDIKKILSENCCPAHIIDLIKIMERQIATLQQENKQLKDRIKELEEYKWKYEGLCK